MIEASGLFVWLVKLEMRMEVNEQLIWRMPGISLCLRGGQGIENATCGVCLAEQAGVGDGKVLGWATHCQLKNTVRRIFYTFLNNRQSQY